YSKSNIIGEKISSKLLKTPNSCAQLSHRFNSIIFPFTFCLYVILALFLPQFEQIIIYLHYFKLTIIFLNISALTSSRFCLFTFFKLFSDKADEMISTILLSIILYLS